MLNVDDLTNEQIIELYKNGKLIEAGDDAIAASFRIRSQGKLWTCRALQDLGVWLNWGAVHIQYERGKMVSVKLEQTSRAEDLPDNVKRKREEMIRANR